ncbi:MAG: deoxyribonuclease V [Anaerolineae bacterium]
MQIHTLHNWSLEPQEAITLQRELAPRLITDTPLDLNTLQYVAGVDVSVKQGYSQAAVVVLSYPTLQVIETVRAQQPTQYPYIPGLLSFREGPVLVEAFAKIQQEPDVLIFDGMGQIHPRKMGIASHMGLWLQKPTIGCGKTYFIGDYEEPGIHKGDYSPLTYRGEQLGVVLRTRDHVKPVYISAGHRIDLSSAIALTLAVTPRYKLPRPIRLAHKAAGTFIT